MLNMKTDRRLVPELGLLVLAVGMMVPLGPARAQVLTGDVSGDRFGASVAGVGDVDGDGVEDFLVGSPGGRGAAGITGTASLFLGVSIGLPETPELVLEGSVGGDEFGFAVAAAGDVNGDGYSDFLVGAPHHDGAGLDAGRAYLYLGGPSPASTPSRVWDGSLPGACFGFALAGGFDFDGDGFSDFAIGAPESNVGAARAGRVEIYLGDLNPAAIGAPANFVLNGDLANWGLGYSLDSAGDVNGDHYEDLIAGAPQLYDVNPGRAVVVLGQPSTLAAPARRILVGEVGSDRFGFSVSGAGDRNQDDYADVVVGAPGHDSQGTDKGAVYVYYGDPVSFGAYDWRAIGFVGGDSLGYSVDGGFDIDDDDLPDLAVGAPGADDPAEGAGQVQVFEGQSVPATSPDVVLTPMAPSAGFEADDRVGAAVRFTGSVNGDVYDDLLVGGPGGNALNGTPTGYVGLVLGVPGSTPVRLLEFTARRVDLGAEIGWSLADAGDLSGLRVRSDRGEGWSPVHDGWLSPHTRSILDMAAGPGRVVYRLEGLDRTGQILTLGTREMDAEVAGTDGLRARGNPFRSRLALAVMPPLGRSRVRVLDLLGRELRILWEGDGRGVELELVWDGRDGDGRPVGPGVYYITVEGSSSRRSLKTIRLP